MAYIESIKLSNFRNYESLELSFDKGTNIFMGIMHREKQISWSLCICAEPANPIKEAKTGRLSALNRMKPISA